MSTSSEMSADDRVPVSSSLHHSDSVPNIFSQINEFAKLESLALKTQLPQSPSKKSIEGNVIRTSVISNLQHMLNLSNVSNRLDCVVSKTTTLPEAHCCSKPEIPNLDRDQDNNQIMSTEADGNESTGCEECDVPAAKKPKLSTELIDESLCRTQFETDRIKDMGVLKVSHKENLTELFFLQNGGNLMDYFSWRKVPNNLLSCYLFSEKLDDDEVPANVDISRTDSSGILGHSFQKPSDCMSSSFSGISSCFDEALLSAESIPDLPLLSTSTPTTVRPKLSKDWASFTSEPSESAVAAASAAYEKSQEAIAELARQEAQVMEKITELRKKGLWSVRRIPKASEPQHAKPHWDYVLEEMQWLAADFGQERKAKKAGARKVARMVVKHFQDQQQKGIKAEKEDALKLKRIASNVARAVKEFWTNIEKVVQYKQQSRLDEKRRKALDMHLSFIVDQTEKFSSWLTEGLGASLTAGAPSVQSTGANSVTSSASNADEDFKPNQDSSDDEETIEKEEQDLDKDETAKEVAALQKEGEMSMEEFLKTLPEEVLNSAAGVKTRKVKSEAEEEDRDGSNRSDADSYLPSEDSTDDEETLEEQEKQEKVDHVEELSDLQKESEMPIEELLKKYQAMYETGEPGENDAEQSGDEAKESDEGDDDEENDKNSEVGMEFLVNKDEVISSQNKSLSVKKEEEEEKKMEDHDKSGPGKEINDIAATALSIQPTGYTLETAHVKTAVPFLLKHNLREYQHVGLDWLATMYEQRLNGILADEMGLGKTIQTIALLGFLACEKGIWGPHLIVVPTSVMLNWEMEIKKWCPAFKILTYYGSLKERKAKRQGWTKTNAFHVCITSYKLVIQDHQAFRRKKWKYFILDEAQNIKNFKSQRWQTLLNFHSQRRLLLTGTPLQNNLMELWSLMHFLMPHVFQSHREFKEWFSNPLTGMIEGSMEYNESLVRRLHKVLRPFLLRRLKQDVEKQMPKKYEHVVMCRLSKRQRFLYDDFMSQAKTKETLASGHFMSVINILMQLRKVCNHPNLFDPRPVISPFSLDGITLHFPSLAARALEKNPLNSLDFTDIHPNLCDLECGLSLLNTRRARELATRKPLIVEIDSLPDPPLRLEPLPDGTQLIVRCPSPSVPESDDPSFREANCEGGRSAMVHPQLEELDVETISNSVLNPERDANSPYPGSNAVDSKMITGRKELGAVVYDKEARSPLFLESLEIKRRTARKQKLERIYNCNRRGCAFSPVYGDDLRSAVNCVEMKPSSSGINIGFVHCLNTHRPQESGDLNRFWERTDSLAGLIFTPEQRLATLQDMLQRFVFAVPPVIMPRPALHLSHPCPSARNQQMMTEYMLQRSLSPRISCLHSIMRNQVVHFPELRLIQYDCGKLQTMDVLLRRLKSGSHRVLIFTQMTRMLDVLEAFLNFHGHRYLRLDGTTKVEQRQALMERFNMDQRIFCFILSTRSGGIGVNLTGADTVIFYDSDWNPTMDAQAQDRCHRIGQTRDVHIYRLISEKTVEENILKKANEKRLLGSVAIEGGNFTTAFFKQQTIKDLFEEPSGLESLVTDDSKTNSTEDSAAAEPGLNEELIEQALCAAEDETDIQAVKVARAEQKAELAEFDETQPWDEVKADQEVKKENEEPTSNVEMELALLEKDLTPVERYAVSFMEAQLAPIATEELQKAEEEVGLAKEEWELNHLKARKEEEERRAELEEDEMLYTSLHYTAWKQQPPIRKNLTDESFDDTPVHRKRKAGRLSNEAKRERAARNELKQEETSPSESWEDSNLSANLDDSRISSSSISTNSSFAYANSVNSTSSKLKPAKRLKVTTSLVVKTGKGKLLGKKKGLNISGEEKVVKRGVGRPMKRRIEDGAESVFPQKKKRKQLNELEFGEPLSSDALMSTPASPATTTEAVTIVATPPSSLKSQVSVTKLLDSKRFVPSHGQRIIVQRMASETSASVSTPMAPKSTLATSTPIPTRDQFEKKPIPILEKLGASVMSSSVSLAAFNANRVALTVNKTTVATSPAMSSHLHVSRLSQIVSSIAHNNTLQNAVIAQSTPGGVQYFLRASSVVPSGVRNDGAILANSVTPPAAAVAQTQQGTSFVIVPQSIGKSNRLIVPSTANQVNKQSVLILPNTAKQNYIVAQQPSGANRQNYILIPNNVAQQNFILTAAAGNSNAAAVPKVAMPSAAVVQSGSKASAGFSVLQTPQSQLGRIVSPALNVVSQQSIPVVQSGGSNTVPILEKLAMQLGGSTANAILPPQQQYRPRIIPSATVVQPPPGPSHQTVRLAPAPASINKPAISPIVGHLSAGSSISRPTYNAVLTGRVSSGGSVVAKQSPVSLVGNQSSISLPGHSAGTAILSRLPTAVSISAPSSSIMLTTKPVQPMNVAQFIINQPRSTTISVEKLTQLAVNGQLVLVDGRSGQELMTSRSVNQPTSSNKK